MIFLKPARIPAEVQFFTESGRAVSLKHFRGKVVLLNFWATWCLPCKIEMRSLDRLQADLGGADFEVVAVSIDREGLAKVKPFFESQGLRRLPIYLDPRQRLGFLGGNRPERGSFALYAFPISYIIDRAGRVVGYFPGPAEWDSPAAKRLMRYYMDRRP